MASHTVRIGKSAVKSIKKLGVKDAYKVIEKLEVLENTPRPAGVEKLQQYPKFWRLRAGDFRIIYTIEGDDVIVLLVKHRRESYRDLDKLGAILSQINLLEFPEQFPSGWAKH